VVEGNEDRSYSMWCNITFFNFDVSGVSQWILPLTCL